jgi:CRISPR system Cascade subunit CasD
MPEFLIFTLAAPYASFGAVAVGERRPSWDRPSKSQVLGLIAGALGIERNDEPRQTVLARAYLFAVRVDDAGRVQSDYHTTQAPPQRRNRRFATRADELAVDKTELKTILSRRENRLGSYYTIALQAIEPVANAPALSEIAAALRAPQFMPFAGRKAHVLMLPMTPHVLTADDVERAFAAYDARESMEQRSLRQRFWLTPHPDARSRIYVDTELVSLTSSVDRYEQRRDIPESRTKWRFGLRTEALLKTTRGAP